jgi:hypothetical protein
MTYRAKCIHRAPKGHRESARVRRENFILQIAEDEVSECLADVMVAFGRGSEVHWACRAQLRPDVVARVRREYPRRVLGYPSSKPLARVVVTALERTSS